MLVTFGALSSHGRLVAISARENISIIADGSPGHTPQYLENSYPSIILGLDNLRGEWCFQDFRERAGALETDQPESGALLSHLLVQTEAKALLSPLRGSVFSSAEWATIHQDRAMRVRGESCVKGFSALPTRSRSRPLELCERADRELSVGKPLDLGAQLPMLLKTRGKACWNSWGSRASRGH